MPNVAKQYKPAGKSPDTPTAPNIKRGGHSSDVLEQGAKIPNTGNLNVIGRMNQGTHHTTSGGGGGKRRK